MLLQHTDAGEILLFPAWPADWEVAFKLHAPQNTVVSALREWLYQRLGRDPGEQASGRACQRMLGCNSGI